MKIVNSLKTLKKRDKNCRVAVPRPRLCDQQAKPALQGPPGLIPRGDAHRRQSAAFLS